MAATWENLEALTATEWHVLTVYVNTPAVKRLLKAMDCTRPDETKAQTEYRIAKRLGVRVDQLILEVGN